MKLFIKIEDHFEYLNQLVKKRPNKVFIASFGIYAGITFDNRDTTEWGPKYRLGTRDFLESLRGIDTHIIIGVPDYRSCKGKNVTCYNCEREYIKQNCRLLNHGDKFPEFKWRMAQQAHVKCILFFYQDEKTIEISGVAGGRNLNDSNSVDATFAIDSKIGKELYQQLLPVWKASPNLNSSSINQLLENQGISISALDKMHSEE
jgi:hypothetical protein